MVKVKINIGRIKKVGKGATKIVRSTPSIIRKVANSFSLTHFRAYKENDDFIIEFGIKPKEEKNGKEKGVEEN